MIKRAEKLAAGVFRSDALFIHMAFYLYRRQEGRFIQKMMRMGGISPPMRYWAALNEDGEVCGVTGLYAYQRDEAQAVWMAWFCVRPGLRGQGIGKQLIEHAIAEARASGKQFFRLYTSTVPNEAAAQRLYEKYGFRIIGEKKRLLYKTLYRELAL